MIRLVTSGAFATAAHILADQFARETGETIDLQRGPSVGNAPTTVPNRLARGEDIDVVIMAGPALAEMIDAGHIAERVDLARSGIGIAIRAGAPPPDIATPEALRETLLAAASIGLSVSVSGAHVRDTLFPALGIADQLREKTRVVLGEPVAAAVARGDIALGFQQISELLPIAGITLLGPLPPSLQQTTIFAAGLVARGTRQHAARGLMHFLASPAAAPTIRASGMDPAG